MDKKIIATIREKITEQITRFTVIYTETVKDCYSKNGYRNCCLMATYEIDIEQRSLSRWRERISPRYGFYQILEASEKGLLTSLDAERIYQSCFKHWYK